MIDKVFDFSKKFGLSVLLFFLLLNWHPLSLQPPGSCASTLFAEEEGSIRTSPVIKEAFASFTGRVLSEKLDVRLRPEEQSPTICQINQDELLLVCDEQKDFWVILPPSTAKAYIFRSFVLDGIVEGSRVNMRLKPDLDSPIIGHLNTGEKVEGSVSPKSKKWLEIAFPSRFRLFVHKSGVQNIGPAEMKEQHERRLTEVQSLFSLAEKKLAIATTLSFEKIDFNTLRKEFSYIAQEYPEYTSFVEKAKNSLVRVEDLYLKTKLAFLESHGNNPPGGIMGKKEIEVIEEKRVISVENSPNSLTFWKKLEEAFYSNWMQANNGKTSADFYAVDVKEAYTVTGVIAPFAADHFQNPPGNFILYKKDIPQAYLYSTTVNLDQYVGREVSLTVTKRPNSHFAFPAFFVHSAEEVSSK